LVITEIRPELTLKLSLPEAVLELTTTIEWYEVLNEDGTFEIGVIFTNFKGESNTSVAEVIRLMEEST